MVKRFKTSVTALMLTAVLFALLSFGASAVSGTGDSGVLKSVKAVCLTEGSIRLKWKKLSGVASYNIYSYDSTKKTFTLLGNTAENAYTVKNCKVDTVYSFAVAPVGKIADVSFESDVAPSVEVKYTKTVPSNLKKTYDIFKNGTFSIKYNVTYNGIEKYPTETYVDNGSFVLKARVTVEGTVFDARTVFLKNKNEGYTIIPYGATGFYAKHSAEALKAEGMDAASVISTLAPDMNTNAYYTTEKKTQNGKVITCESFIAKSGKIMSYCFDSSGNLICFEETNGSDGVTATEVTAFSSSVDSKNFDLPFLFPMGYVGMELAADSHSHYDSDGNGKCDKCAAAVTSPAHSHTYFDKWVTFKSITCTADGAEARICSGCDGIELRKTAAAHNSKSYPQQNPTCTAKGYTEGVHCERCKKWLSGHAEIPALGHKWSPATCTQAKTCSVCKATEGGALGHKWIAATCTEAKKCSVCKVTEGGALGHKWVDATCTQAKRCTVCKITEGGALGHKWVDATCTEAKKCTVCKITDGEALGHKWADATCTKAKTCTVCKDTEGDPLGHKWIDADCTKPRTCSVCKITDNSIYEHKWKKATCTEPETCSECGQTRGKKDPDNHSWKKATCTKPKTCRLCKKTEGKALGHKLKTVKAKNPTCTENGNTKGKQCKVCDKYTVKPKTIKALGHKEEIIKGKAATYKSTGKTDGKKCTVCGEITEKQKKIARKKLSKVKSLKAKDIGARTVTLTWKKVKGAESYKVYYSTDGKKWKATETKKTSLTVKKLKSLEAYQFRVRAYAGKYSGSYSELLNATTLFTRVSDVKLETKKSGQISVSWKAVKNADGYIVEYSTSKNFTKKTTKAFREKDNDAVKYTLKKLKSAKKYYVRVRAYTIINGVDNFGQYSSVKNIKVK